MRQKRKLAQGVWYEIRSQINNREQILSLPRAAALFSGVFRETTLRFAFEVRGLRFGADQLRFYIKPEDGMELPVIMQWLKQTFAQRYNALTGRTGHIWGDRYWSLILEGEPPADVGVEAALEAAGAAFKEGTEHGDRPRSRNRGRNPRFSAVSPAPPPPAPG
ncbi:MAG: transposase [Treponema sp.]|jgi:REP element-mobilizing transposase RayT|nr:transposase [Treponema sp.]